MEKIRNIISPGRSKPAFEEVYDRYYFDILRFVSRRVDNSQDAEDLTSEAFLYCYSHYDDFDPEKSSVSTWLYIVVKSRIKNYYRDRRSEADISELENLLPYESDMDRAVYLEELRGELASALDKLSEKQRTAVLQRYFQNKEYSQIALELGTTPGNVRVIISRALDRLEELCAGLL